MFLDLKNTGLICLLAGLASAHMEMRRPVPIRHRANPNNLGPADLYYNFPLKKDGSNYPCRGHLNLLGTPDAASVAKWPAGSVQEFELGSADTVIPSGTHFGGSCQVSLSYDYGADWKVIKSWEGACPNRLMSSSQIFNFTIPDFAPPRDGVLFAWSWHNRERESFMNCAVIDILPNPDPNQKPLSKDFNSLPQMLMANIGNDCVSPLTTEEVQFPNPGDVVVRANDGQYPRSFPQGAGCGSLPKYTPLVPSPLPPPPPPPPSPVPEKVVEPEIVTVIQTVTKTQTMTVHVVQTAGDKLAKRGVTSLGHVISLPAPSFNSSIVTTLATLTVSPGAGTSAVTITLSPPSYLPPLGRAAHTRTINTSKPSNITTTPPTRIPHIPVHTHSSSPSPYPVSCSFNATLSYEPPSQTGASTIISTITTDVYVTVTETPGKQKEKVTVTQTLQETLTLTRTETVKVPPPPVESGVENEDCD